MGFKVFFAFLGWIAVTAAACAAQLTAQEERGKQIYVDGVSPSAGTVSAFVGKESVEVPGFAVPCVGCHGEDGLGRPEGGVIPPNITWGYLTKSYGHVHENGRRHPAFSAQSVARALRAGVDPAGNRLEVAMPRYAMSEQDMADLIAYLKRLESDTDPGVAPDRLTVGTLLPVQGRLQDLGRAMKAVIDAYFQEINAQGGVYQRRLELVTEPFGTDPQATQANLDHLIAQREPFALVSVFVAGTETGVADLMDRAHIPLVGPFTLYPQDRLSLNRYTFYLFSGLRGQARALVEFAARHLKLQDPRIAVVGASGSGGIAKAVTAQAATHGWRRVAAREAAPGRLDIPQVVGSLREAGTDVVLFFGAPQELRSFVAEAAAQEWSPYLLLPGALAGRDILTLPHDFKDRVFLAYPTLPSDHTQRGIQEFAALQQRYHLPEGHLAAQISAYTAAKVLVEALKRAGKEVSRDKLLTALEGLYRFDTGLTPPISFGPNRRIGALGAYVVAVDLEHERFSPVGGWIALD